MTLPWMRVTMDEAFICDNVSHMESLSLFSLWTTRLKGAHCLGINSNRNKSNQCTDPHPLHHYMEAIALKSRVNPTV